MRHDRMSSAALALAVLLASCADEPEGTVTLVTGDETDAFTRQPAPVTLVAEKIALDGARTEIARQQLPADSVDLGKLPRTEAGALGVRGLDASGNVVLRGETLFVQWGAIEATGLEVFVQRTGELARMPRGPAAFEPRVTAMVAGRYVVAANGPTSMIYDLLSLRSIAGPTLPRPARSIASVGVSVLLVDEAGATTFDLSTGNGYPLEAPAGGTFAEVAGGQRVIAPDAKQYIAGGTREGGGPSGRILVIDAEGKTSFAGLTAPREGACATYVEGRGLVVIGGDPTAAGAELLAPGAAIATPLPFPPDAVRGCGAATLDNGHVAVVSGAASPAPVRVLDLACTGNCTSVAWPDPIPLVRARIAALAPDAVLVLGDDADGNTHAYRASTAGMREVPLRIPRRGAQLVPSPTGALTVVGGGAGIEQYLE